MLNHSLHSPDLPGPSHGQGAEHSQGVARLDPQALQRLRDLDPQGRSKLLERVVQAFNDSVARLAPQLRAAQAAGDAAAIRHVAHTMKSSSASIGAVKLSQMCAEVESLARQGLTDGMQGKTEALLAEIPGVTDALTRELDKSR